MKRSLSLSPPHVLPSHSHLDNQNKKLKTKNANLTSGAQEGNTGQQKNLPGIYAEGKSRAHIIRKELQAQREPQIQQQNRAAEKIQALWRGYAIRSEFASKEQQLTPYASLGQFQRATYSFSLRNLKDWPIGSNQRQAEYRIYQSTNRISSEQPAFLHSYRRESALNSAMNSYNVSLESIESVDAGNIYEPFVIADGAHNMKINSVWLLGLAHHQKSAVLTTSLDDETLVRKAAEGDAEHNVSLSALGREVLGMVQNGLFTPQYDEGSRLQVLMPTPQARLAKLADFKTPSGMKKEEIKEKLAAKGIDVSKITTSS